ncbi:MAG: SIS domain-containing protein [Pyrinomonadaceae bacterium]
MIKASEISTAMLGDGNATTLASLALLSEIQKAELGVQFTPGEIRQQPETWKKTFRIFHDRQDEIRSFLDSSGLAGESRSTVSVSLIGAGTSDYIGRSLLSLLRSKWKCGVTLNASTDLLTESDSFVSSSPADTRHLWISFSRSGDSFEGVRVLEQAYDRFPEIRHIIVTCNSAGRMANDLAKGHDNVMCLVLPDEVNDRGLAMTSSFTNMVVAGQCLANIDDLGRYQSVVETLSSIAETCLPEIADAASALADQRFERICFLGSGPLKGVADESALKVLELSGGFHSTMSESFLGLRHGPLSWLNKNSLVVGFVSNDPEKAKVELGLLAEIRKKKAAAAVIAVAGESPNVSRHVDLDLSFPIPSGIADDFLPPFYVLFGQCLGLFSSLSLGLMPDSPSADGKIQRVVSNIEIA